MRNAAWQELYSTLSMEIDEYQRKTFILPGLIANDTKDVFVRQLIDSIRRVGYPMYLAANTRATAPSFDERTFDPLKIAAFHCRSGSVDEAAWMIFLATHFGKSKTSGWLLTRDVYCRLDEGPCWSWEAMTNNVDGFRNWAEKLPIKLETARPKRTFGNHRKYESLRPDVDRSLSQVVESYRGLVEKHGGHGGLLNSAIADAQGCKYATFDSLYRKLDDVVSFGRTAKFDFLTMIGKLGIAEIEPSKTYMVEATGPKYGAQLLYDRAETSKWFENQLFLLSQALSINPYGMQVLEDALCNWQKNPCRYKYFSG